MSDRESPRSVIELRKEANRLGCEIVTAEFLEDVRRTTGRLATAERELRAVAALRLVSQRKNWRGRLARRWIKRTQGVLDLLARSDV